MAEEAWAKAPVAILEHPTLTPLARLVYVYLLDHADNAGNVSVGLRRIADALHADRKTIADALAGLATAKLVVRTEGRSGQRDRYQIMPPPRGRRWRNRTALEGKSGGETGPVEKSDRSENRTASGGEIGPRIRTEQIRCA